MIDLPVATLQPYPTKTPWYDISSFLTVGITPAFSDSVLACPDANFIHYVLMVTIDREHPDLEVSTIFRGLPNALRTSTNTVGTAWFTKPNYEAEPHRTDFGWGYAMMGRFPAAGLSLSDFTGVSFSMTAPRRNP